MQESHERVRCPVSTHLNIRHIQLCECLLLRRKISLDISMDDRRAHVPKSQGNHVERHARFQIVCRRLWDETRFLRNLGSSATARVVDFHPEVGTSVHLTAETMSRSASSNETDPAGPGGTDNNVQSGQHQASPFAVEEQPAVRPAFCKRRHVLASAPLNPGKSSSALSLAIASCSVWLKPAGLQNAFTFSLMPAVGVKGKSLPKRM